MDTEKLKRVLRQYRARRLSENGVLERLKSFPYEDIGCAKVDTHRSLRFGFPEVVLGEGKSVDQLTRIIRAILKQEAGLLVTRVPADVAEILRGTFPVLCHHRAARVLSHRPRPARKSKGYVAVVTAGTSDMAVAEEAAVTGEMLGDRVERIYDVGVAGLHRLLDRLALLNRARCLIVAAGMEGALPSVVGGLVDKPVIGVPTSIGYGTGFGGIAPLLTMLNSCTPNVVVVNIDNGFGAAFFAHLILRAEPDTRR